MSFQNIKLSGEQKIALTLPIHGAVLIKGGAGSGKTLVSVKRAEMLLADHPDLFRTTNVAIFTYTNELVSAIEGMVRGQQIAVHGLDRWIFRFLGLGRDDFIDDEVLKRAREHARAITFSGVRDKAIANKNDDFYCAEISWLKGRRISNLDQYKNTKRTGRGTEDRVTMADRELLWKLFEAYNCKLAESHMRDWDDRVLDALAIVEKPGFVRPFSHVVIDEAQDFSFSRISLIRQLVSEETNSITIVADSAQQIYQSGFSWSDLGLKVVGRSVEFKRNYRNTRQIAEAAYSLMRREKDNTDFTEMIPSSREGVKPIVLKGSTSWCLAEVIRRIKGVGSYDKTVVAVYSRKRVAEVEQFFENAGVPVRTSARKIKVCNFGKACVTASTYHSLKGLQFDHVYLLDMNDQVFSTKGLDPDEISKMRKLIYVAMTRACETLTIVPGMSPTPLLAEIDSALMTEVLENG